MARKIGAGNLDKRAIKEIIDSCVDMKDVVSKMVELTNGVTTQRMQNGIPQIYTEKPDAQAAKLLLEYRYGKPLQSIAHSGEITEIVITKRIVPKRVQS